MVLKLDMSKPHDHIEWHFLHKVLMSMNFVIHFIDLIMRCVTSVTYSIVVNVEPGSSFNLDRGLRQGIPLSPYLFILCEEFLSCLLDEAHERGELHGIRVGRSSRQSHTCFC